MSNLQLLGLSIEALAGVVFVVALVIAATAVARAGHGPLWAGRVIAWAFASMLVGAALLALSIDLPEARIAAGTSLILAGLVCGLGFRLKLVR